MLKRSTPPLRKQGSAGEASPPAAFYSSREAVRLAHVEAMNRWSLSPVGYGNPSKKGPSL